MMISAIYLFTMWFNWTKEGMYCNWFLHFERSRHNTVETGCQCVLSHVSDGIRTLSVVAEALLCASGPSWLIIECPERPIPSWASRESWVSDASNSRLLPCWCTLHEKRRSLHSFVADRGRHMITVRNRYQLPPSGKCWTGFLKPCVTPNSISVRPNIRPPWQQ